MQRLLFEGSSEIGAYAKLTNTYAIIGSSINQLFRDSLSDILIDIPVIEVTINSIKTIGSLIQGNKNGLLVPSTTHDYELLLLRNSLPDSVRVRRIDEKLNALGNVILCNDHVAIVHPEVVESNIEVIENVLGVEVHRMCIGNEPLVGSFGLMNNQGLLVECKTGAEEQSMLKELLGMQVVAGTVNTGSTCVGGGAFVNDWVGFCGRLTSNPEISVMEKVFLLKGGC